MALKNLLVLVVLLGVVGVSVAHPYGNPLKKQNGHRNPRATGDLDLDYYRSKCPQLETIVRRVTFQYVSRRPTLAAALLRMHFHDCFVRSYEVIDAAKSALERTWGCRGLVSCADIIALVARDAVSVIGGPWWPVPLGRRDGRISKSSEVNLPSPFSDVKTLKKNFLDKGLNTKDLVVLSGAHTIGVSSCGLINNRIHNFTGRGDFDPAMTLATLGQLKKRCKPTDVKTPVDMDPGSAKKFDSHYFNIVAQKKGLFTSDATLLDDLDTNLYIQAQVLTGGASFNRDFSESMVKLGFVEILTGKQGEFASL
ncbi:Peroxidase 1 [Raphanus sativus]|nr:Peroxidase 1 [Raphanus sativus]